MSLPIPTPLDRRLPEDAFAWIEALPIQPGSEPVDLPNAFDRVLAEPLVADADRPARPIAVVDGYGVVAAATAGAGAYNPLPLRLRRAGELAEPLTAGVAQPVAWGEPLPPGCDAVLPLEDADPTGDGIEVCAGVAAGSGLLAAGEHCRAGEALRTAGHRLRAQDLALLRLLGRTSVDVWARPRVALLLTAPAETDGNAPMLRALLQRDGAELVSVRSTAGDVRPLPDQLVAAAAGAGPAQLLLVLGATGLGANDGAPAALAAAGMLEMRGVAIEPGETLSLGRLGALPVCLLPGPALACFSAYELVVTRLVRRLAGLAPAPGGRRVRATLARKIASPLGVLELVRVRLRDGLAEPLDTAGGQSLRSLIAAQGTVLVPLQSEGLAAGSEVDVHLFETDGDSP